MLARRRVFHGTGPIERGHDVFQLFGCHPRCIKAADDRTHAGTGYSVNRYPLSLELLEHTDVGGATRTAATEHEANARPLGMGRHANHE